MNVGGDGMEAEEEEEKPDIVYEITRKHFEEGLSGMDP